MGADECASGGIADSSSTEAEGIGRFSEQGGVVEGGGVATAVGDASAVFSSRRAGMGGAGGLVRGGVGGTVVDSSCGGGVV